MIIKKLLKELLSQLHLMKYYEQYRLKYQERKIEKRFIKNRLAVIKEFDELLFANNINYSIIFGTLLGAVREKGFIPHDSDIDVSIWYETDYRQIEKILTGNGFNLIRRTETDNGNFSREDTYSKKGVLIDIFTFYPYDENLSYTTVFVPCVGCKTFDESFEKFGGVMPVQLILPYSEKTERIPFESITLPAIVNRNDFIVARYGENWKIPDPTFVYPKMGDVLCNYRTDKITKKIIWN